MAFKPIEILINAKDNASVVFTSLQTKVVAVGTAIAAYFGISAFAGVVRGAADFEAAMSRVKAATGASGAELESLRQKAEAVGATGRFTAVEAADALTELGKAGLTSAEALQALQPIMDAATADQISLAQASDVVTSATMGMGLSFADAGRVADVLAKGAADTKSSILGMGQALSYAAPAAQSLGLTLESTVALIGQFAQGGIDASRAGTALNSILSQFSNPASKFREELAAAGISTSNFEKAIHDLANAGPAGQKAILAVGQEAGPALRALLNKGMESLDQLTDRLRNAEGSAAAAAKVMGDNLNGSLNQLSGVWDTLKNKLGTPVLPVLKEGVDQLAEAFRKAVQDGTVTRFGESIATAFRSGIQFVRDFVSTVNFDAVVARMQAFAASANETLTKVGEYAANAGNTIKLAYGVMSAGVNGVLTAIYGIGSVFAEVASTVMSGVAKLREGLASITFGGLSDSFKLAAEDARSMAEGFGDAAQAMRDKAAQALQDTADAAQTARNGFEGLAGVTGEAAKETDLWALAVANAAAEIERAGKAQARATAQAQASAKAANDQASAARAAAEGIAALRAEYEAAVSGGAWQRAAELQQKINDQLREAPAAAQEAAEKIEAAFRNLGMTTTTDLNDAAAKTSAAWDTLTAAGVRSASVLREAFAAYANAAMAAAQRQGEAEVAITRNILAAKAAAAGLSLEVDRSGQIMVRSMRDAEEATHRVGRAASGAAGGYRDMAREAAQAAANAKALQAIYDKHRLSADKDGKDKNTVGDGSDLIGKSRDIRFAAVNDTDINQQIAARYGEEAVDEELAKKAWQLRMQLQAYQTNYGNARSQQSLLEQRNIAAELDRVERLLNDVLEEKKRRDEGRPSAAGGNSSLGGGNSRTGGGGSSLQGSSSSGGGSSSGGSGGPGMSGGSSLQPPTQNNSIVINVNGVTDPAKLARLLEPELKRRQALAR